MQTEYIMITATKAQCLALFPDRYQAGLKAIAIAIAVACAAREAAQGNLDANLFKAALDAEYDLARVTSAATGDISQFGLSETGEAGGQVAEVREMWMWAVQQFGFESYRGCGNWARVAELAIRADAAEQLAIEIAATIAAF